MYSGIADDQTGCTGFINYGHSDEGHPTFTQNHFNIHRIMCT